MKFSKEVKVGLFMILAIVMLYFGFNFLKGIDFLSSDHKYYAIYKNVDKLTESNQIFLNGCAGGWNEIIEDIELNLLADALERGNRREHGEGHRHHRHHREQRRIGQGCSAVSPTVGQKALH